MKKLILIALSLIVAKTTFSQSDNNALNFAGTDHIQMIYFDLPDDDFTMEAWVNPTDVTGGPQTIYSSYYTEDYSIYGIFFKVYIENSDIHIILNDGITEISGVPQRTTTYSFNTVLNSDWMHIAIVVDGTNLQGYLNNELVLEETITAITADIPGNIFSSLNDLGYGPANSDLTQLGDWLNGTLDEFRLWSDARTTSEISLNYYRSLEGWEEDLAIYYDFNEGAAFGNNFEDGFISVEYRNYDENCGGICPPGEKGIAPLESFFDSTAALTITLPTFDLGGGDGSPGSGVDSDFYTTYAYGVIRAPETNYFLIEAFADDGVQVYLDGELIIDRWSFDDGTVPVSAEVLLFEGQEYFLEVLHFEAELDSRLGIYWSTENLLQQNINSYKSVDDKSGNGRYGSFGTFTFSGATSNYVPYDGPLPAISNISPTSALPGDTVLITGSSLSDVKLDLDGVELEIVDRGDRFIRVIIPEGAGILPGIKKIGGSINFSGKYLTVISRRSSAAFSTTTTITSFQKGEDVLSAAERIETADLDNDGDLDLIVASQGLGEDPNPVSVGWYENLDGRGAFGKVNVIYQSLSVGVPYAKLDIYPADINRDNKVDVVIADADQRTVRWVENEGDGSFKNPVSIFQQVNVLARPMRPFEIEVADFNGDGLHDVVFAVESEGYRFTIDSGMYISKSSPGGYLEAERITNVPMMENFINERTFPNTFNSIDYNGDGLLDIVAGSKDGILLLENDGSGQFTEELIYQLPRGFETEPVSISSGDIDGDGDIDAVVSTRTSISYFENINGFLQQVEVPKISPANELEIVSELADLDGDGDLDILSFGNDRILFHRFDQFTNQFSEPILINGVSSKRVQNLKASDMDNDGQLDVLAVSSADSKVVWFKNNFGPVSGIYPSEAFPGDYVTISGANFTSNPTENLVFFNDSLAVIDPVKSNGSKLVVKVPEGMVGMPQISVINRNTGIEAFVPNLNFTIIEGESAAIFWNEILAPILGDTNYVDVELADLDNDNDLEIITLKVQGYPENNSVAYVDIFENTGNSQFEYRTTIIDENFTFHGFNEDFPGLIVPTDIDNDGNIDLVVNKAYARNLDGNFNFSTPTEYTDLLYLQLFSSLVSGDVNGDGFVDLVGSTSTRYSDSPKLIYYENDGLGDYLIGFEITVTSDQVYDLELSDIDGDGDLDILTAEPALDKVSWFENIDGKGTFNASENIIDTSVEGLFSLAVSDLDEDGDFDVIVGGGRTIQFGLQVRQELAWFENRGSGVFSEKNPIDTVLTSELGINDIRMTDLNGDSKKDILISLGDYNQLIWYPGIAEGFDGLNQITSYQGGTSYGSAFGDLNNDGDIDIVGIQREHIITYENIWLQSDILNVFNASLVSDPEIEVDNKLVKLQVQDTVTLSTFNPTIAVSTGAVYEVLNSDFADTVKVRVLAEIDNTKDYPEDFSSLWSIVTVKIPGKPVLDTLTIKQRSAKLQWNNDLFSVKTDVEISENSQFIAELISGDEPIVTGQGVTSLSVTELKPGTRYYARIRSANEYGSFSRYSNRVDFLTLPGTPVINNVNKSSITSEQARVSWTPSIGEVDNYEFYLQENIDGTFSNVAGYPLNTQLSTSVTIGEDFSTGFLNAGTEYRAFVLAENETGKTATSDTVKFITISDGTDLNLVASEIQTNQFSITWDQAKGAGQYIVDISDDDFATSIAAFTNLRVTTNDTTFGNLDAGTAYSVRVRVLNAAGISQDNSSLKVSTLPEAPEIIPISVTDIYENTFELDWNTVVGNSLVYEISIRESSDGMLVGFPLEISENSLEVGRDYGTAELKPGAEYWVKVRAKNSTGFSAYSDSVKVLTRATISGIEFSASQITNNSFNLEWLASAGADYYELTISEDDFETSLSRLNERKVISLDTIIGGMQSGTGLSCRLTAVNSTGKSLNSTTIKLVTLPDKPDILPVELPKITTTTSEIDWNPVNGNSITYEIELATHDFSESAELMSGYPLVISETSIELGRDFSTASLTPGTVYWVRLRAKNSTGFSGYSDTISFKSLSEKPLISIDREKIGQDSVILSWDPVPGTDTYLLDVSLDNFQTFVPGYSNRPVAETNYSITGLVDGEYYYIRLFAQNASGLSAASNTSEVLIKPGTPLARGASEVTPIKFTANWDPVQRAESYQLQISEEQDFSVLLIQKEYEAANPVLIDNLEEGTSYFYRVRSINETGFSTFSNTISVVTVNPDPISVSLTFDDVFDTESDNVVGVLVTGGYGTRIANYRWRSISDEDWSDFIDLTELSFGQYQFVAQGTMLDQVGMEFEVAVTDELGKVQQVKENFIFTSISEDDEVSLPLTAFGGKANTWQLFSIPYELEDNLIESIFDEVASKEYKKEWRLMHYQNSNYIDFGEGLNRIELGKSYWFNAIEKATIGLGSGQSNKQVPFVLSLQQGWNQIGNPYNVNIEWNRVLLNNDASGVVGTLVNYDGVNPIRNGVLEPFKGGFVFAEQAVDINIQPSNSATTGGRVDPESYVPNGSEITNGWEIKLNVINNNRSVVQSSFGMSSGASAQKDRFDFVQVPKFLSYTELSSQVKDYFYSSFERDIRPLLSEENWSFTYNSNQLKGQSTIRWDVSKVQETLAPMYLVNLQSGEIIDMRVTDRLKISKDNRAEFKIYYGQELEDIDFEDILLVGAIYPNPVEKSFSIPVITPSSVSGWNVEFELYNTQGKRVYSEKAYLSNSGYNIVPVNLTGASVNPGVYLLSVKLSGDSDMMVQRKVLVK